MSQTPELIIDRLGGLAVVTLNRPQALNALTHTMVIELGELLRRWANDPAVKAVLVKGAGEKAFCAGGDIRKLYDARLAGKTLTDFFYDEYRTNSAIHHFPKPYIALMNGVTMGGGVGISAPGRYRIATERSLWAMPETAIGLFPDVGGSWHLPRLSGQLGLYLGLTGHRLKAADMVWSGLATHAITSDRVDDLIAAIAGQTDHIDSALARVTWDPGVAPLTERLADIDRLFSGDRVEVICEALAAEPDGWAQATLQHVRKMSPTSLKLTFSANRRGAAMTFDEALAMEYRLVSRVIDGHDFIEGVRAVLVDRDHTPQWSPASLAEVSDAEVENYFAALPSSRSIGEDAIAHFAPGP